MERYNDWKFLRMTKINTLLYFSARVVVPTLSLILLQQVLFSHISLMLCRTHLKLWDDELISRLTKSFHKLFSSNAMVLIKTKVLTYSNKETCDKFYQGEHKGCEEVWVCKEL